MKNGKNFEWVRSHNFQEQNLKWLGTFTHDTININITYLAPVTQRQSNNGYKI